MGQTRYPSKIWVFKSHFSFKVRQHGQQQLYLQCKVCWILYKMIGTPSFSQPYLCIQPTPQYPQKTRSSTSVNSHLAITPLLVHKIILTIPTNNPLLYTFAISHFHLLAYNHPNNLQQKYFPISTICKASCRYSCENWFFIPQIQKLIYYRCGKPSNLPFFIPSTYCNYFHTLLIPSQELKPKTSDFSWFSS